MKRETTDWWWELMICEMNLFFSERGSCYKPLNSSSAVE